MKLVLHLNDFSWPVAPEQLGATLTEIAQAGETAGFDSIAVMDHLWQHPMMGGPEKPVLECYAALNWIAARTSRIGLVALATAAPYRSAGLLAKMVTSLDVLSGGRAWLGIGAGDYEEEARGLGVPYPSLADRFAILEETIQVCLQMWSGEHGSDQPFTGAHVHLERSLNLPQSLIATASADPDRRKWRATHPAPGRAIRRCLQHPAGSRDTAQAGRAAPTLRGGGSGL